MLPRTSVGLRKLSRTCALVPLPLQLVFLGSRRGRPPLPAGDFERPVDEGVAAEAARLGGLKGALQLITDAPALDGPWEVGGE